MKDCTIFWDNYNLDTKIRQTTRIENYKQVSWIDTNVNIIKQTESSLVKE